MINNYVNNLWIQIANGASLGRNTMLFFGVLFFMIFSSLEVMGQEATITSTASPGPTADSPIPINIQFEDGVDLLSPSEFDITNGIISNLVRLDPTYKFLNKSDLVEFPVNANPFEYFLSGKSLDEYISGKVERAIISIDFNDKDELFYLTYGKGVYKYNPSGNDIQIITGDKFDSPLDLVISKTNQIIVADKDKYRVRIFAESGLFMFDLGGSIGKDWNEFYGPSGLAIDNNNRLYVADAYTGSDPNGLDQVKIYDISSPPSPASLIQRYGNDKLVDPYRIAVDKNEFVYVSDSGGSAGLGRVQIFNPQYLNVHTIEGGNQGAPGSLILDDYGYLYVVDYEEDLAFNEIFSNPVGLMTKYNTIKGKSYSINVFNKDYSFIKSINENLKLPVDLALNNCGHLFVNDLTLGGTVDLSSFTANANFDFNLIEFKRQDSFTAEIVPVNPGLVTVALKDVDFFKCDPQPEATFSIEYKPEDNNTPEAKCKAVTLSLDGDGNATLTAAQIYDGDATADKVTLSLDKSSFNCSNLGANSVTLTVTGENGKTATCLATVNVVDTIDPIANCVNPFTIQLDTNGEASLTEADINNNSSDNCGIGTRTLSQSNFNRADVGENTITLTITDTSGRKDTCNVLVTVEDNNTPEAQCKPVTLSLDANGNATLTAAQIYDGDATADKVTLSLDKSSFNCSNLGANSVTLTVTGENGKTATCLATVTVVDTIDPIANCVNPFTIQLDTNGEASITEADINNNSSDNCGIGTRTLSQSNFNRADVGENTIILTITDTSGRKDTCNVLVTVEDNNIPEAKCKPVTLSLDANGNSTLNAVQVYDGDATADKVTLSIDKSSFNCSNLGANSVTLTVTDENGNTASCLATVNVTDNVPPTVNCPQEILVQYSTEKTYTVPDFSSLYSSSDNCSTTLNYFQTPDVGTVITEDISASFRVGDESNNFITCNFNIKFIKDTDLQITNCPGDQNFEVGENCEFTVPDYTSTITANDSDAIITQSIPAGTEINNALPITITASLDGQTASCEFQLIPKDSIDPVVICPGDVSETYNPEDGFALPNYSLQAQTSDNCTVAKIDQIPDVGTVIFENTEVTVRIEDIFGNSATCTFNVILTEENTVNTPPVATDDIYTTLQDVSLTVPASTGVLSNDTDGEGDGLSAILISSVSSGTLSLNQDGSFIYEPNAGFFGSDSFTYVSNDGSENSEIATVRIDVVAVSGNTVTCKEAITLELNENGTASLSAENLFVTRPANLQFSIDKENFTCDDLGEIRITLSYSNDVIQGSCEVLVTVKDVTPPMVNVKDITVALNEFRSVRITPEMVDNGSSDNCENITLSLDKLNFSCKELGENIVTLIVTDSSGNSSSATARVTVTGSCDLEPLPVVEYIFIYPNPTTGPFQFATPAGVTIQRVEAFDARGRMIMFKEFSVADLQYTMDLNGVQKAVYILKLFTSDGIDIKRVIIK